MDSIRETFTKLEKEGKNDVKNLTNMMKESKLIEDAKVVEKDIEKTFKKTVADKLNFEEFKTIIEKVAKDQKKNIEEVTKQLGAGIPRLAGAVEAGLSSLKAAFK